MASINQAAAPPAGTTAQRPDDAEPGAIRYNTDLGGLEVYQSGDWTLFSTTAGTADALARLWANTANGTANNNLITVGSAYGVANTALLTAQGAFEAANAGSPDTLARTWANTANGTANNNLITVGSAFTKANVACTQSDTAGTQANNAYGFANTIPATVATAYAAANTASNRANTAYNASNTVLVTAQGAFAAANTANVDITARLWANTANLTANNTAITAVGAFAKANVACTQSDSAGTQANLAYVAANTSNLTANNNLITVGSAFAKANVACTQSDTAGTQANLAYTHANNAYISSNSVLVTAQGAFAAANTANVDVLARTWANTANLTANNTAITTSAAFAKANVACTQSDTAGTRANLAYVAANTANLTANNAAITVVSAFAKANLACTQSDTAGTQANLAYVVANTANLTANNTAITAVGAFALANISSRLAYASVNTVANVVTASTNNSTLTIRGGNNIIITANTANGVLMIADDTRNEIAAFAKANVALTTAQSAFATANAGAPDSLARTWANTANLTANNTAITAVGAFAKANLACTQSDTAGTQANLAYTHANNAYISSNSVLVTAQGAFGTANLALSTAQSAFATANAGSPDSLARTWANTANATANTATTNLALKANLAGAAFTGAVTVSVASAPQLTVSLSDDGTSVGPNLRLDRISASPAVGDLIGAIDFYGRDSGAAVEQYGTIRVQIIDPTATSEDALIGFQTALAGAFSSRMIIAGGIYHPSVTGGDKGNNTLNIGTIYENDVRVATTSSYPFPAGSIYGFTLENSVVDATNDLNIQAGSCRSDDNLSNITVIAMTKQLDAAWAAGTAAGMRDTGAISNATWHIFAINNPSSGANDILASLSATAPTMPAGYTYFRRIGSIIRSAATILGFKQTGNTFWWNNSVQDYSATTSRAWALLTTTVPTGIYTIGKYVVRQRQLAVGDIYALVGPASGFNNIIARTAIASERATTEFNMRIVNTSAQIYYGVTIGSGTLTENVIETIGWTDDRNQYVIGN